MNPYACHNREPFREEVEVQRGWRDVPTGVHQVWDNQQATVRVPAVSQVRFRMNPDCQYTKTALGQADPRCEGCKHKENRT